MRLLAFVMIAAILITLSKDGGFLVINWAAAPGKCYDVYQGKLRPPFARKRKIGESCSGVFYWPLDNKDHYYEVKVKP